MALGTANSLAGEDFRAALGIPLHCEQFRHGRKGLVALAGWWREELGGLGLQFGPADGVQLGGGGELQVGGQLVLAGELEQAGRAILRAGQGAHRLFAQRNVALGIGQQREEQGGELLRAAVAKDLDQLGCLSRVLAGEGCRESGGVAAGQHEAERGDAGLISGVFDGDLQQAGVLVGHFELLHELDELRRAARGGKDLAERFLEARVGVDLLGAQAGQGLDHRVELLGFNWLRNGGGGQCQQAKRGAKVHQHRAEDGVNGAVWRAFTSSPAACPTPAA